MRTNKFGLSAFEPPDGTSNDTDSDKGTDDDTHGSTLGLLVELGLFAKCFLVKCGVSLEDGLVCLGLISLHCFGDHV